MSLPAYSYSRYSSAGQRTSASNPRQRDAAEKFIGEQGWTLAHAYADEAVSAYTGENIQKGAIAAFVKDVEDGNISTPCALVLEKLDRLTRQQLSVAMPLLMRLLQLGVTVATTMNNRILRPEDSNNMESMMVAMIELNMAHEYSDSISKRVRDSWGRKKANAARGLRHKDTGEISGIAPFWIRVEDKNGKPPSCFKVDPQGKKIVRRIFKEYIAGQGFYQIANGLNKDGYPPPSKLRDGGKRKTDRRTGGGQSLWSGKTIQNTLMNVNVIGSYQPKKTIGKNKRTADGAEVENYYPKVIGLEEFQKVQGLIESRKTVRGKKSSTVKSLVNGLCVCSKCGWNCINQSSGSNSWNVTVCQGANQKRTFCKKINLKTRHLEAAIISLFLNDIFDVIYAAKESKGYKAAKAKADQAEKKRADLELQINEMLDRGETIPKTIYNVLNKLEKDVASLKAKVAAIPSNAEWDYPWQEIRAGRKKPLELTNENRSKIRDVIHTIINRIEIDFEAMRFTVEHWRTNYEYELNGERKKIGPLVFELDYKEPDEFQEIDGKQAPSLWLLSDPDKDEYVQQDYQEDVLWEPSGSWVFDEN